MRQYKEDQPTSTINNIRQILHHIDLLPIEQSWFNPNPELFSVRLENPFERGKFGTNGKGRDVYYALASAYAEFIERLQNGFISGINGLNRVFLNEIKNRFGFYYYPDERPISQEEFWSLPKEYLSDVFGDSNTTDIQFSLEKYFQRLKDNGLDGVIAVPFYDCQFDRIVYFPYNLTVILSGSNGMAAGNTPAEGIFQALCELIERFAARTVFFERLTPPTVPDTFLSTFSREYEIINKLKKDGFDVVVKDFSCGLSLPAVGVILIDVKKHKYRLNIGCDTSFRIALSRALTEIFQGVRDYDTMNQIMLDIPDKDPDYFLTDSIENYKKREEQIRQFIINGEGVFPHSLFLDQSSYVFNPSVFCPKDSYKEEVRYLINLLLELGYPTYIRDVSFLGFPSFHVYIPGISMWGRKSQQSKPTIDSLLNSIEHDRLEDIFFPTESLLESVDRLHHLLDILAPKREVVYSGMSMAKVLKLEFSEDCVWNSMPVNFFISLLCFVNNEFSNAKRFLEMFLIESSLQENDYYQTVLRYFSAKEENAASDLIEQMFPLDFLEDFSSISKAFAYIPLPTCPKCTNCPLCSMCLTKENMKNALRIAEQMRSISINQQYFKQIVG